MSGTRGCSALVSLVVLAVSTGCAAQPSQSHTVAAAEGCPWLHASYQIDGRSGSRDLAVSKEAVLWVPLTPNQSPLNPEISATLRAGGKLEVRMRTDNPDGEKEYQFIWLGLPLSDDPVPMFGEITRSRPHVEPGVAWPEYNIAPGLEVVGTVFVTCRRSRAPGTSPGRNSFAI